MKIYIHTYGRAGKQVTLDNLPPKILQTVCLVVQSRESKKYLYVDERYGCQVLVLPKNIIRLSPTRQWLLENCPGDYMGLLDDDLIFFKRGKDLKLSKMSCRDFISMFALMKTWMSKYKAVHCGISAREGNNRISVDHIQCSRMMRALFYNVNVLRKEGVSFNRIMTKQDFDMTLQLLRRGYPNPVSYLFAHNQSGGSNSKGGCSSYRTNKVMNDSAYKLAKLHPGFVKVVEKKSKSSWGGGSRVDVRISWKKAYESSFR